VIVSPARRSCPVTNFNHLNEKGTNNTQLEDTDQTKVTVVDDYDVDDPLSPDGYHFSTTQTVSEVQHCEHFAVCPAPA